MITYAKSIILYDLACIVINFLPIFDHPMSQVINNRTERRFNMTKSGKIVNIGNTKTEIRQRQHDNNPGKVIVDIFIRGIDIPEEKLSDDLKETVRNVRAGLQAH